MRYIVTGGAGFIGSNLVERLIKEGHEVSIVDNFHTGSLENVSNLGVSEIKTEIWMLNRKAYDGIFHLGMPSSAPMYTMTEDGVQKGSAHIFCNAIKSSMYVFNFAITYNIPVVFASSSSLYNEIDTPHQEASLIKVTDFYTEARLQIERLAELYGKLYGLKTIGLRLFSAYGKNDFRKGRYANMLTQFFYGMKNGDMPTIYGDGTQTRDFTHVDDIVEAFVLSMDYTHEKDMKTEIFNIGTGIETSFNEAVGMLNEHLGTSMPTKHQKNPYKNYVLRTKADTSMTRETLGFEAKTTLKEGISKTYKI